MAFYMAPTFSKEGGKYIVFSYLYRMFSSIAMAFYMAPTFSEFLPGTTPSCSTYTSTPTFENFSYGHFNGLLDEQIKANKQNHTLAHPLSRISGRVHRARISAIATSMASWTNFASGAMCETQVLQKRPTIGVKETYNRSKGDNTPAHLERCAKLR